MTVSTDPTKPNYIGLINESVHSTDDEDIGDIYAISRDFIVIKRGFVNVHYYYIPISKVEGWDGNVLWLKISENEVKRNYERDTFPEPTRYYLKDFPYQNSPPYFPQPLAVPQIPSKYQRPDYTGPYSPKTTPVYRCDLCNTLFKTEDELSKHVRSKH